MIEIKLRQVIDSINVMQRISQRELPGRVAYNVAKLLRQIENEFNLFDDTRKKLLEKYADKNEDGTLKINEETNEYVLSTENLKSLTEEVNLLLDTTITLNANRIKITDISDLAFTPVEMAMIEEYIEE